MSWCLDCHRAPERYLNWNKDVAKDYPGLTPRELVFKLYWKLQTKGKGNMTQVETELLNGHYNGTDDKEDVKDGKDIIAKLGIRVQQLSDCSICHR